MGKGRVWRKERGKRRRRRMKMLFEAFSSVGLVLVLGRMLRLALVPGPLG